MTAYDSDVVVGERYRDEQTGLEGVATAVHFYQYACERATVEHLNNDGEVTETTFDAPRLVSLATGVRATTERTGGPARAGETRSVPGRA